VFGCFCVMVPKTSPSSTTELVVKEKRLNLIMVPSVPRKVHKLRGEEGSGSET